MKTIVIKGIFIAVILTVSFPLLSPGAGPEKRIGILMFSDETRYIDATKGIVDELKLEGFAEPGITFVRESGGGNKARTAELVKRFAESKLDMIVTLGTSATAPIAREIRNVPIVFCVVYDPVDAGIARDWKSSGNNTTGVSTKIRMSMLLDALRRFAPVKNLAVLYTPSEKNSESQLRDLQAAQGKSGIKVIPVPLNSKEDIGLILPEVIRTSDSVFISGSNIVNAQISKIVTMATIAKVPTVTHLEDLVEKGVLLGVCADPYLSGRLAGKKAAKVLRGVPPSSIPIETLKGYDVLLNGKTARAGQFAVPREFAATVKRVIE